MSWAVINADALEALRAMPDASVDAICTDPPAGISFMGKTWDDPGRYGFGDGANRVGSPPTVNLGRNPTCQACGGRKRAGPKTKACTCDEPQWNDPGAKDRDAFVAMLSNVMAECLRVLKPGGHALVWAIPRTSHWTGMAIELAGFEVRDVVTHLFGSGFPKSKSISKAIDEHDFAAWLSARPEEKARYLAAKKANDKEEMRRLRIAAGVEREVVSRYTAGGNAGVSTADKGGTYGVGVGTAAPVELAITRGASARSREWDGWGTALKPACEFWILARKPLEGTVARNVLEHGTGGLNVDGCRIDGAYGAAWDVGTRPGGFGNGGADKGASSPNGQQHPAGRWPANIVLSHTDECTPLREAYIDDAPPERWQCAPDCPVAMLDAQSGNRPGMSGGGKHRPDATPGMFGAIDCTHTTRADQGGASRFFANFKSDEDEWAKQDRSQHDQTGATSPVRDISAVTMPDGSDCSTTSYGSSTMDQFQKDSRSTIRTKTSKTTDSRTSNCSTPQHTSDSIPDANCATASGGNRAVSAESSSRSTSGTGTSANRVGPSMVAVDPATLGLYANPNNAGRIGYFPKTSTREREAGCDALPLKSAAELVDREEGSAGMQSPRAGAGRTSGGRRNSHPTCKSIALMRWLVRLITPPGGIVLDPFMGSGSTGCACVLEGANFIGIDQDADYVAIAQARIAHWEKT